MMDIPSMSPRYQVRKRVSQGPALTKSSVQEAPSALVTAVAPIDGDEEEADQGPAAGEVEGVAEDVGESEGGEDDLDGVGERDTEGESEPVAVEDVGERIGAEANGEVLDPEVAGAKDDEGEEHPVGEPDGGDTFGGVRELDAEPGEEEQNEEGEGELHIVREAAPRRRWECVGVKKALRVWLREGLARMGK